MIVFMFWCIAAVIFATFDFFSDSLEGWDWGDWEDCTYDDYDMFDDFFDHDPISSADEINSSTGLKMIGTTDAAGNHYGLSNSHFDQYDNDCCNSDIFSGTGFDVFDSLSKFDDF